MLEEFDPSSDGVLNGPSGTDPEDFRGLGLSGEGVVIDCSPCSLEPLRTHSLFNATEEVIENDDTGGVAATVKGSVKGTRGECMVFLLTVEVESAVLGVGEDDLPVGEDI